MKITKFLNFVCEQNENTDSAYEDVKSELKELIEKSLKTSDKKTFEDFVDAYIRNPEDTQIEGLINDADVYEFYLKYRNNIDQKLSDTKFYDEKPSEMECFSLYDYIVKGTKKSLKEFLGELK
jgi:hypothetical protein